MINIIKKELDDYLEFDSNKLFKHTDLIRVFGGAIRDIIAEQPIHDVDILVGSRSLTILETLLNIEGYHHMTSLCPKDLQGCYTNIRVINEPHTWVKGSKVIQLIGPATGSPRMFSSDQKNKQHSVLESYYKASFTKLISNVDLSCCGVSYDGKNLYENFPSAILHCKNKVFKVNEGALMYNPDRIIHRTYKMAQERGWTQFDDDDKVMNRDIKINLLINEDMSNIAYVAEYKTQYPKFFEIEESDFNFDDLF